VIAGYLKNPDSIYNYYENPWNYWKKSLMKHKPRVICNVAMLYVPALITNIPWYCLVPRSGLQAEIHEFPTLLNCYNSTGNVWTEPYGYQWSPGKGVKWIISLSLRHCFKMINGGIPLWIRRCCPQKWMDMWLKILTGMILNPQSWKSWEVAPNLLRALTRKTRRNSWE